MKKLLILFVTLALLLCLPFTALATSEETIPDESAAPTAESSTESKIDGESAPEAPSSAEDQTQVPKEDDLIPVSDKIISFITEHYGDSAIISFVITGIVGIAVYLKKNKGLLAAIGVFNKNAITVAQNSDDSVKEASAKMEKAELKFSECFAAMQALMDEIRKTEGEKKALETLMKTVSERLERFKLADIELADEIAQLLNLSNLPTSVKDELYARHKASLALIEGANAEEVSEDDGKNS